MSISFVKYATIFQEKKCLQNKMLVSQNVSVIQMYLWFVILGRPCLLQGIGKGHW